MNQGDGQGHRPFLGEGAAGSAPTAPHATPRATRGKRTGPERFWSKWPVRVAFALSLVVSAAAHSVVNGFGLPGAIVVNDFEGEAAIPIDLLDQGEPPQEEPPAAPPPSKSDEPERGTNGGPDSGAVRDAETDAADARVADANAVDARAVDGGEPEAETRDAGREGGEIADSGAGEGGGRDGAGEGTAEGGTDPDSVIAASDAVQADVVYVTVLINALEIRQNPAASELGVVLRAVPQWNDFMQGTEGLVDPVRDADWILISGPSLRDTSADVITLHFNIADSTADRAAQIVSRRYARGGPYDAGVPGVRAWLVKADNAERVIERPRSHLLVIVPPRSANKVARQLVRTKDKGKNIMPGVATWARIVDPHHALPNVIPEGITELRLKVSPRDDLGADILIEGDCKDAATASHAAELLARVIRENNTFAVSLGTHGLLNRPDISSEGKKTVLRVTATREQIEATLASVQFVLPALTAPPAPGASAPASPAHASPSSSARAR